MLPSDGGRLDLKPQHPRVRIVAKRAIDEFIGLILTVNAYPDSNEKSKFAQRALLRCAKGDQPLYNRIKSKEAYRLRLTEIVRVTDALRAPY